MCLQELKNKISGEKRNVDAKFKKVEESCSRLTSRIDTIETDITELEDLKAKLYNTGSTNNKSFRWHTYISYYIRNKWMIIRKEKLNDSRTSKII